MCWATDDSGSRSQPASSPPWRLVYRIAAQTVRRLAILALSGWKKTARPYAAAIRRLFDDPNADVASTAKHCLKEVS